LNAAGDSLFTVLFPSDCRLCGVPLAELSRVPVCGSCLQQIARTEGPLCSRCGERLLSQRLLDGAEQLCGECRSEEPLFARAIAYGSYEGGLRDLVHLLKYERVRPAANLLGRMLAEAITDLAPGFHGMPLVIPVPLHPVKQRERGFNQSELIARAALKLKPAGLMLEVNTRALVRQRDTASQTGLTREQRQANMRGAFAVVRKEDVAGREILLIDDVCTTGTTVSECARVLRRAGVTRVWVATVARALKQVPTFALRSDSVEDQEEERPLSLAAKA